VTGAFFYAVALMDFIPQTARDDCFKGAPMTATTYQTINLATIQAAFPKRAIDAHKQSFGHLWIYGGSMGFTGAPKLAASGAMAVGTGLVSIACPAEVYPIIATSSMEVMVHPQPSADFSTATALLAGPGWGSSPAEQLNDVLHAKQAVVLDADALNMISSEEQLEYILSKRQALSVLTPHPGEAGRLLGIASKQVQSDRQAAALALVERYHCWIVLKGFETLIISPELDIWLNPFGSAKLATAGTGDVLAGMIGGLLAAAHPPDIAIPAAVGLHGLAGEQRGWYRAGQLEGIIANFVESYQL